MASSLPSRGDFRSDMDYALAVVGYATVAYGPTLTARAVDTYPDRLRTSRWVSGVAETVDGGSVASGADGVGVDPGPWSYTRPLASVGGLGVGRGGLGVGGGRGAGLAQARAAGGGATASVGCGWRGPVGPNYERNKIARDRRKAARQARREGEVEVAGKFSGLDEDVQLELTRTLADRLLLENKRRIIEEKRLIDRLNSPVAFAEEALRVRKIGSACSGDSKLDKWAKSVTESGAESVARSAPSSAASLDSFGSTSSASSPANLPFTRAEGYVLSTGRVQKADLKSARKRVGRALDLDDFMHKNSPIKFTSSEFVMFSEYVLDLTRSGDAVVVPQTRGSTPGTSAGLVYGGRKYTRMEASNFVDRYSFVASKLASASPDTEVAATSSISVAEVQKLRAFKRAFGI